MKWKDMHYGGYPNTRHLRDGEKGETNHTQLLQEAMMGQMCACCGAYVLTPEQFNLDLGGKQNQGLVFCIDLPKEARKQKKKEYSLETIVLGEHTLTVRARAPHV